MKNENNWTKAKLSEVSSYVSRGINPSYVDGDGLIILNQKCIRDKKVNFEPSRLTDGSKKLSADKKLKKFDVLVNSTGVGTLGRVAQYLDDKEATVDSHITIVRPESKYKDEVIDPRFFGYSIINQQNLIESLGAGATGQTELSKDVLAENVELLLPPISIQKKISKSLSLYDDLIDNNAARIKILEDIIQATYTEWFINFRFPGHKKTKLTDSKTVFGEIPEGWKVSTVEDTFAISGGGTPSKKVDAYWSDGVINWYTPSDLTSGKTVFVNESGLKINELGLKKSSAKIFPEDTVLLTSRATIGVVAISTTEATTNQGFINCIPSEDYPTYLIYMWLKNNKNLFEARATGATFKELSKSSFKTIELIVPDKEIINKFVYTVDPIFNQIKNLEKQLVLLRQARDLLMPKLVTGEVEIKA